MDRMMGKSEHCHFVNDSPKSVMQVDLVSHEPVKKELLCSAATLVCKITINTRQEDRDSNPGSPRDRSSCRGIIPARSWLTFLLSKANFGACKSRECGMTGPNLEDNSLGAVFICLHLADHHCPKKLVRLLQQRQLLKMMVF